MESVTAQPGSEICGFRPTASANVSEQDWFEHYTAGRGVIGAGSPLEWIGKLNAMPRLTKFVFVVSLLVVSWLLMQVVHEFGHVTGAWLTAGRVRRLVLHPLAISRTDVSPNPSPLLVVWLGPIVGGLLPSLAMFLVPARHPGASGSVEFFAGYCLTANGAYIAIGSIDQVGDCAAMLQLGTPHWVLLGFGAVTIPLGLYIWHKLGSLRQFVQNPDVVSGRHAWVVATTAVGIICVEIIVTSAQVP